ncbi:MAG: UDP-N-acetylmuramate dehydrogenase [Gammaproteobacteria bacterium]
MIAERHDTMRPGVRGSLRTREPMGRHSSWRCGGPAAVYFEPADRDDLLAFLADGAISPPVMWLGLGSNLLVRDGGLERTVIATAPGLTHYRWESDTVLYAECGVTCARLAREGARRDRAGLEFLAGIPGTLGGALAMNAGALGAEIWSFVRAVETVDAHGVVRRHESAAFEPRYRGVSGPETWFLAAWLELPASAGGQGPERIRAALARRSATQPTGQATCGSVFKNPPGDYAGRLIEQCGLKGRRVGRAEVSPVHANFIVNEGEASAADIETLIETVRREVAAQTGITLECEVLIVGEPGGREVDA